MLRRRSRNITTYFLLRKDSHESRDSNANLLVWFWFYTCCLCQTVAYVLLLCWLAPTKPCHHPPQAKKTWGRSPTPLQREVTSDCGKEPRQEQHHVRRDSHGTWGVSFQNRWWCPSKVSRCLNLVSFQKQLSSLTAAASSTLISVFRLHFPGNRTHRFRDFFCVCVWNAVGFGRSSGKQHTVRDHTGALQAALQFSLKHLSGALRPANKKYFSSIGKKATPTVLF